MDANVTQTAPSSGLAARLGPEVLTGLGAVSRVARALVGAGELSEVAERALADMSGALDLDVAVLFLPETSGGPVLRRYATYEAPGAAHHPRDELAFDEPAWRLAVSSGLPLVFRDPASWLVENPFVPQAGSWLVLPLASRGRMIGVVIASAPQPIWLEPALVTALSLLGDLLSAGVATARLRQEVERAEVDRERMQLAAEIHDGLAQDLGVAVRELALLDTNPPPDVADATRGRLREAVSSANRLVRARLEDLTVSVPLGGLGPAVEAACAESGRRGQPVRVTTSGVAADVPPDTVAVVLRVLAEALGNARKHAEARTISVDLSVGDAGLTLLVEDDGRGFRAEAAPGPGEGHFGLTLMRERARSAGGVLAVGPAAARGTRVSLEVPLGGPRFWGNE